MNRKILMIMVIGLLAAAALIATGCANKEQETEKEYTGIIYFANEAYAQTGNEELDHLIPVEDYKFQCEEGNQYFYLVDVALRTVPEGLTGAATCIDSKIIVNDVTVKDGTAVVDLAGGNMNGGSLTETFVIGQIVESLFGSFEEVTSVQFLVDGEKAETLMGHYDVQEPFTRDMPY